MLRSRRWGRSSLPPGPFPPGHVLVEGDLVAKSPADDGLPPYALDDLLGKVLVRALVEEEAILVGDVGRAAINGPHRAAASSAGAPSA